MKLTQTNYFSTKANSEYFSVSQFKAFQECEAAALAQIRGEWERETTDALLQGSYVDAHFSGTLDQFLAEHPEVLNKRTGELKAAYTSARSAIVRAERDPMFMEYMDGEKQVIMTGEISGQKWKCKIDVLHDDKIVDLKYMRDMKSVYKQGERKTFVSAYQYDLQGYVYQELVRQNTGKRLPFYLAVITKESPADIRIIHIPDAILNSYAGLVDHYTPKYALIKNGELDPDRCEACAYCRETKVLTGVTEYEDLVED